MRRRLFLCALLAGALLLPASQASAATAPQIEATWVTDVTATSAVLRTEINPGEAATTYRFEYISLAAYEANLAAAKEPFTGASKAPPGSPGSVGSGSEAIERTQHVGGLAPAGAYRFRVSASNEVGPVTGPERSLGTEEPTNAFTLLDNRGWEMVSPIDKNGGAVQAPEAIFGGGVFQAAADGQSLTYSSADSFGAEARGAPAGSQYIATRNASGWQTQNITAPLESGGYTSRPNGVPYQLFAADLSRGLMLDPNRCEGPGCPHSYSLRESSSGALTSSPQAPGLRFEGASPDLHQIVLGSPAGLKEWSEGETLPLSEVPGSVLAAPSGAISTDGERVYFYLLEDGGLYLAGPGGETKLLPETVGTGAAFQLASADGSIAYFTKGAQLYRYDAISETSEPIASEVQGVLGGSADGRTVYYLRPGGLFVWEEGSATEVAEAAAPSDYPPATGTARVSADGKHLLFLSAAELTGYESNGAVEAFLYGPAPGGGQPKLLCVSCNPTGERPQGAAHIPGAIANGQGAGATHTYKPRALSADGNRVFFESADDLAIQDTNSKTDVYEWEAKGIGSCAREGGCIGLISSGRSPSASTFIDASAEGSDAFFLTDSGLAFGDPGSFDLYDAREGGGFPTPPNVIACDGDACQPLPEAPEDPTPGTLVPNGGNPPARFLTVGAKAKKHKPKKHKGNKGKKNKHQGKKKGGGK